MSGKTSPAQLKAVRKYNVSAKGKLTRKKYIAGKKEKISRYNKHYQQEKRERAKNLGYCCTCRKRQGKIKRYLDDAGIWRERRLTVCDVCSELNRKNSKRWREKHESKI